MREELENGKEEALPQRNSLKPSTSFEAVELCSQPESLGSAVHGSALPIIIIIILLPLPLKPRLRQLLYCAEGS